MDEFSIVYKELVGEQEVKFPIDQAICEEMTEGLKKFNKDAYKKRRLEMTDQLYAQMEKHDIFVSEKLFYSLVYLYTESQQWKSIISLMHDMKPSNCRPDKSTIVFLKRNLVYCFDSATRTNLKSLIEEFEKTFFRGADAAREEAWKKKKAEQ